MTTAFVLSGGGSLGAVQVGMLRALSEHGVVPDLLVGTSAGALNAVFVAGHGTGPDAMEHLAATWIATRRADVFPLEPRRQVQALRGRQPSLFGNHGLRRLIAENLNYTRLEDAPTPVRVVATDLLSGREVVLDRGDAMSAVLASTAIPGMLPPVSRDGLTLVDGGLADNAAISVAAGLGADVVYVLPTGYSCALPAPPSSAVAVAMQSLDVLIEQRLVNDVAFFGARMTLRVLPPLCPLAVSPVDFRQARTMIERAYRGSLRWIADGGLDRPHPERFLSLHSHGERPTDHSASPVEKRTSGAAGDITSET